MVRLKNICFSYKSFETGAHEPRLECVFGDFSMELREGEALAVMGESGSGKTTLVKLMLGLIKPDSGSIEGLDGKRISVVFQEDRLLPWYSAKENIALVLHGMDKAEREQKALELLAETELSEAADKPIRELSGGMQRRVSIARALAFGGDIIILDEPLKGLDAELKKRVAERIRRHFSTILLITHDEDEAALFGCNRIISASEFRTA
ncbi:MAG: ATP-binding cassette domain-containing protein [Clostridia bacterium]|nr:ATP-binding cassette domain-containing protein [Clostridia bacterium]